MKQRGLISNIVLATLLVTLINIVGSYYLQSIIDTYVPDQMRSTLGIISIGLVIVYILQQILSYAQDYLLLVLGQRLSIDVILSHIKHVFTCLCPFCDTQDRGNRVSFTDANSIIDALASTILSIFPRCVNGCHYFPCFIFTKYQSLFHDLIGTSLSTQ